MTKIQIYSDVSLSLSGAALLSSNENAFSFEDNAQDKLKSKTLKILVLIAFRL